MNETTYSAFSMGVHERTSGKRVPMEVSIEVTRRCPLECLHCYNNLPMADRAARNRELSLEEYRRLLDQIADAGCFWILFTGGEIFARADFLDIYSYAKSKGFLITLFTNGTMITERIADFLAEYRPFAIEITLYGATRKTYDALTQIPGSYDRCIRGIRLLIERKLPLKLKTVPTTINRHEVYEMQRMAQEDFGVDFKFDPLVNPRIDCSQSPVEVRLTPEDAVALDLHDARRRAEALKLIERDMALPAAAFTSENIYSAAAASLPAPLIPTAKSASACFRIRKATTGAPAASAPAGTISWAACARKKKDAPEQVRRLPHQDSLRHVRGQWRTGKRRRRISRGIPVRSGPPARHGARRGNSGARRLRMLRGRNRARPRLLRSAERIQEG